MKYANTHPAPTPAIRAYLGGSFNPVHDGHIQMAMMVYKQLLPYALQQHCQLHVALMPNARSPFKDKTTSPKHRLAMLKLAVKDTPLEISELELWQSPPVYSIDSVHTLRARYPNDILIFIMGMDSAASLDKWKDGLDLTDYVHLWVFNRADDAMTSTPTSALTPTKQMDLIAQLPTKLQHRATFCLTDTLSINNHLCDEKTALKTATYGRIYMDTRQIPAISSTQIRHYFRIHTPLPAADDLPHTAPLPLNQQVYHYIITHQLYSGVQLL